MQIETDQPKPFSKRRRWRVAATVLAAAAVAYGVWFRPAGPEADGITFVARRGSLPITILEGGSIEARESQEIRSEIKGYQGTKILSIVEEGYLVTEEDVKNGKVLVELDSSELRQRITTQDIQFQSTLASLTEAQQAYEIQVNQNKTDVKAAERKARFARMDLEKFLGDKVTTSILERLNLESELLSDTNLIDFSTDWMTNQVDILAPGSGESDTIAESKAHPANGAKVFFQAEASRPAKPVEIKPPAIQSISAGNTLRAAPVDFSKYADEELLGDGEAKQKLRKLKDDLLVAQNEQGLAETKLAGTRRLQQKDFVTKAELDNELLTVQKATLKVDTAKTALDLFIKYEFPKTSEELLSKYEEALQSLVRARKEAVSRLAQARARLESARGRFRIEDAQRRELYDQYEKCVIRAKRPGLVVYGGGSDRRFYYGEEQIREGATVRERQPIITIPDMTRMAVRVKVHEAYVKKVKKGLKARIRIDAFPDEELTGEVAKVGVLPDSQDRFMNPDLKVYTTVLDIEGVHEWVKPGMSAKVEILVDQLEDVVYVPIQAVSPSGGKHVCYVVNGRGPELREVEVGEFNDEFIEIKSGLQEGEKVLLRGPPAPENREQEEEPKSGEGTTPENAPKTAPPPPSSAPPSAAVGKSA